MSEELKRCTGRKRMERKPELIEALKKYLENHTYEEAGKLLKVERSTVRHWVYEDQHIPEWYEDEIRKVFNLR